MEDENSYFVWRMIFGETGSITTGKRNRFATERETVLRGKRNGFTNERGATSKRKREEIT